MGEYKRNKIYDWKKYGVISNDFDKLYEKHMSINNCQLCEVLFDKNIICLRRTLDHDHSTGLYRQTLCHKCNRGFDRKECKMRIDNTSGHKNISYCKSNKRYIYNKQIKGKKVQKYFKTLEEALIFKDSI